MDIEQKVHDHFSKYPVRNYPKGQILIFANESPTDIYYMVSGRVRKYDVSYRGDEVVINVFKPPAFFPISLAINHMPNRYYYKAETPIIVHIVPGSHAYTYLIENPDVCMDLISRLYTGLEGVYGRLVHLMSGSAHSRLMYELLIECRRFGVVQPDGSYLLDASESDLAARSGLTRETVSREIHKLKLKQWLEVSKRNLIVKDITKFEKALGEEL